MKIREVMRPGAFTIGAKDCLGDAHDVMLRAHIRHLPVTKGDRIIGMLSQRDILAARAQRADNGDWWTLPVEAAMQSPPHTAHPDDSLTEVAARMAASKIGAMPITEYGKVLGIVTVTDVLDAEVRAANLPRHADVSVADAMTAYPFTVHPNTRLADAAALMLRRHVRHLPVVDSSSTIVGMLSERDVRSAIGGPVQYLETARHASGPHVSDVMSKPPHVTTFDRPLADVAKQFADERLGALPIVDRFGALIGILSYVDALRLLSFEA